MELYSNIIQNIKQLITIVIYTNSVTAATVNIHIYKLHITILFTKTTSPVTDFSDEKTIENIKISCFNYFSYIDFKNEVSTQKLLLTQSM